MGRDPTAPATARTTTLGLLAGGAATRLGGHDKAWLERAGIPQVLRWRQRFAGRVDGVLVSANRGAARYRAHGLQVVGDRVAGAGPMAGLSALAAACATPWLLTLPVDLVDCNDCLLPTLAAAGPAGAWAQDDDGAQPLVALWETAALRRAADAALADGVLSVKAVQARLGMPGVALRGVRFGNLNTPADLVRAGARPAGAA